MLYNQDQTQPLHVLSLRNDGLTTNALSQEGYLMLRATGLTINWTPHE